MVRQRNGGGDWSPNRIVPDIVNSLKSNSPLNIRSPLSVRPWQHVLDTLHGYILLAQTISESFDSRFHSFNFGPDPSSSQSVLALVERAFHTWPGSYISNDTLHNHETSFLTLSSHKAATMLKWHPILSFNETVDLTIGWYKDYIIISILPIILLSTFEGSSRLSMSNNPLKLKPVFLG